MKEPSKAAKREIDRLAVDGLRKAMAGESADDSLGRISSLQRLICALPPERDNTWIWATVVAVACVSAITAAAVVPIPRTRFELDLVTSSVSFRLASPLRWQGKWSVDPTLVRFQNVERPELPDFPTPPWRGRASFDVSADRGTTSIRAFGAETGTLMSLDASATGVVITANERECSVELNATGVVSVVGHDRFGAEWRPEPTSFDVIPAVFGASGSGKTAVPASMRVNPLDTLELEEFPITDISFVQEATDTLQRSYPLSRLRSGTIVMTDVMADKRVKEGSFLRLLDTFGTVVALRVSPDGITIRFEGTARYISIGRGSFHKDLRPTVLEYLFHQEKVGFFWGALTFLWGLAWSARKILFLGR